MNASFSEVSRDTDQGNEGCVQVSRESARLEPTATGGELWFACEGAGLSTGGRAHSPPFFFAVRTKESNTCVQFLSTRMLGYVLDGQP